MKVQSNSRIQFDSNQSKLVPKKLDPGPSSKVSLISLRVRGKLCLRVAGCKLSPTLKE